MKLDLSLISGVMCGFELIDDEDEGYFYCVVDLFIIRLVFSKDTFE